MLLLIFSGLTLKQKLRLSICSKALKAIAESTNVTSSELFEHLNSFKKIVELWPQFYGRSRIYDMINHVWLEIKEASDKKVLLKDKEFKGRCKKLLAIFHEIGMVHSLTAWANSCRMFTYTPKGKIALSARLTPPRNFPSPHSA